MDSIRTKLVNFIHIPFDENFIQKHGNQEIRQNRMVNYISLITMGNMFFYSIFYILLDFELFKPGILFLIMALFNIFTYMVRQRLLNYIVASTITNI